ncbi:hypothetical protein GOV04_05305 [Candidatus Woesearchaeota archaeon]|nr:hypothetical protein [Candidatus Woesearchaeota archaeon]
MTVIGFNFTTIKAEKKGPMTQKVNIKKNVGVNKVEKTDVELGSSKQDGLKFHFEYTLDYTPKIGNITLGGELLYLADSKTTKDIIKKWEKDKKVDSEIMQKIFNAVLLKAEIQAIILSRDLNLPPPIQFPKVKTT